MLGSIIWWLRKVQARRKGRTDGKDGIPSGAETLPSGDKVYPPGEFRYKETGDRHLRQISRRWEEQDARLKESYCATLAELRAAERVRDKIQEDVTEKETAHKKNLEAIEGARKIRRDTHGIEQEWRFGHAGYVLLMLGLFVGEIPLNAIAFRIFRESELFNYLMTFALAVGLIGGAHVLGVFLRNERRNPTENLLTIACFLIPLGALVAIAFVRQGFLTAQELEAIREAQRQGQEPPLRPISPGMATLVFVLINLLIYSIAALLSYFSHEPLTREIRRTERPFLDSQARLAAAERRVAELQVRLNRVAAVREKLFAQTVQHAHGVRNDYEELFQEYRAGNLEARSDKTFDFGRKPEIKFPEVLGQLDWNCETPGYVPAASGEATSRARG